MKTLPYIPGKGYGTLPLCESHTNANLLTVFLDAQHDFLCDRLYAVAARVVAHNGGEYAGGRLLVRLSDGPPDSPDRERDMLADFLAALLRSLPEKAAPDEKGRPRAPIHLVFWNEFVWKSLLAALARHLDSLLSEFPAVYDLLTQKAAFASPMTTFLDRELGRKNLPLVCPSLTGVASYLGFDWGEFGDEEHGADLSYRQAFRARLFDATGRFEVTDADNAEFDGAFYTARARFNSQVPLEYAYAAWRELPSPEEGRIDLYRAYRGVTEDMLVGLMKRRLKALAHIADDFFSESFRGNPKVRKTPFDLPELGEYHDRAETLAGAMEEFCLIERHVGLADWKAKRLPGPEERLLRGDTLIARYHEDEQPPLVNDDQDEEEGERLPAGTRLRLRLWDAETGTDLARALSLSGVKVGDRLLLSPRWVTNDWAGDENGNREAEPQAPTPEQMLYSTRVEVISIEGAQNVRSPLWVVVEVVSAWGGDGIFQFPAASRLALTDGAVYTLDPDPNNPLGQWQAEIARRLGVLEGETLGSSASDEDDATSAVQRDEFHAFYDRITGRISAEVLWPQAAADGQARFLAGLDALRGAGLWTEELEEGKRRLVGAHGNDGMLLVQGPPGTGKSTTTALAVLSRLNGALVADLPLRAYLSCKTHAATDVLLHKVRDVQERLAQVRDRQPDLFARHFHPRLLDVPLARLAPKSEPPVGIVALGKEDNKRRRGRVSNWDWLQAREQVVVAGTPGGIYRMVKGRWQADIFGHKGGDLLVLDEASQMSLPEVMLAALPLRATGQVIVVGDPRQMPPIVVHDWENEPRRTFQTFRAFESVYHALLLLDVPQANSPNTETNSPITQIKFERSFRVHRDVAEFLRREVYQRDSINYHSTNDGKMPAVGHDDPLVAAVLDPDQPIIMIVHDEDASQTVNGFEGELLAPILSALADPFRYALDAEMGLGIVVPHRAQRAALKEKFPGLAGAVDTVERYQGGEREVIIISATESDPEYLAEAGEFLLQPQRMTVALSRARKKLILVASKSIFSHRSTDEGVFRAAGLWKNLLRKTCTERLWQGEREGHGITVWGKTEVENQENG